MPFDVIGVGGGDVGPTGVGAGEIRGGVVDPVGDNDGVGLCVGPGIAPRNAALIVCGFFAMTIFSNMT